MSSTAFRDSLNSLGWSRREAEPVNTSSATPFISTLNSYNPFSRGGYVSLPTHNEAPGAPLPAPSRREEEEGFFALSRWDRMLVFGGLNIGAAVCFMICFFLFPAFITPSGPRKFAILWSFGSVLFLASWAVLLGLRTYIAHLASGPRLPFTAVYLGSIALTLYFAIGLRSRILTPIAAVIQLISLAWYLVSYFPMGSTGMRLAASFGANRAMAWMSG